MFIMFRICSQYLGLNRDPRGRLPSLPLDGVNVLDVGCGAGLPGIVLAVAQPSWEFTLLDSNSKKTGFVQQVIIELGLCNVRVHCERVEKWQTMVPLDGIISRAFSGLGEFIHKTRHLIDEQGRWAAMKGVVERELDDLPEECCVERVIPLQVPGLNVTRNLVIAACKGE